MQLQETRSRNQIATVPVMPRLHSIPAELVREEIARDGFVFKESRPGFYDAEYGKKMYFLVFEKPVNSNCGHLRFPTIDLHKSMVRMIACEWYRTPGR